MISTKAYNNLPTVTEADSASEGLDAVKKRLLDIVTRHGLSDKFGVRLIHKHFDMNDGEIPVFRDIDVQGICIAIFMGPVRDNSLGPVFGQNFLLDSEGAIVPFEYTTSPCEAPSEYPGFVEELAHELLVSNAAKVLGLCTSAKRSESYTEFELPSLRSTIMIPTRLMPVNGDVNIVTNWAAETFPAPVDGCGHWCAHCKHRQQRPSDDSGNKEDQLVPSALDAAMKNPDSDLYKVVQTVTATA